MRTARDEIRADATDSVVDLRADDFLDRRIVAIVFVDVASSTERAVEMTDRVWCDVLDSLDLGLADLSDRLDGTIANRTGDGCLVLFDGAARAIRFGQLAGEWARALGLDLRIGVHAGEIETRGDQVAGVAIHAAARVQAIAEPGEVVVTEPVMTMSFGSGLEFGPRAEEELKGLPGRWRLWTVSS